MDRALINFFLLFFLFSLPLIAVGYIVNEQQQITPNDEFFTNSITPPPKINASSWTLSIYGHVQSPTVFDYENLTVQASQTIIATVQCVEGYSDTAEWRGIPLREILSLVQVNNSAFDVIFYGLDGYSSSLSLSEVDTSDVLLVFEMNGEPLPENQGFPLRVIAPGHAGYKWVMWVYEIEVVDYDYKGFWETRGWSDDASYTALTDWLLHASLFSLTFLFGGFSIVSGLKMTGELHEFDLPRFIKKKQFHIPVTVVYLISATVTFAYWTIQTLLLRGSVFYSLHGWIALASMVGLLGTGITGLLKAKGMARQKTKTWHLNVSTFTFTFYTVTVIIGILYGIGFRSLFF